MSIMPKAKLDQSMVRLIGRLLDIHPNTFSLGYSTIFASSPPSKFRDVNTSVLDSPLNPVTLEVIAELDRELGLGLGVGNTQIEAYLVSGHEQSRKGIEMRSQNFTDFNWDDVLRAYVDFSTTSKPTMGLSSVPSITPTPTLPIPLVNSHPPFLPPAIHKLIAHVHAHSLSREPIELPVFYSNGCCRTVGMSPKKAHEVTRMAAYVASIVQGLITPEGVYIVDVGAGQGHLAREILRVVPGVKGVLALDGDSVLVERQARVRPMNFKNEKDVNADGENDKGNVPKLMHKFGHITSPERLADVVDEWLVELEVENPLCSEDIQKPVVVVSLHGCGSLSLDVLRAFVKQRFGSKVIQRGKRKWGFVASVTVPCCYNLLREGEYPLYTSVSSTACFHHHDETSESGSTSSMNTTASHQIPTSSPVSVTSKSLLPCFLPPNAYHLAAQVPGTWIQYGLVKSIPSSSTLLESSTMKTYIKSLSLSVSASLAVRKVVWRALLECVYVQKGIKQSESDTLDDLCDKPRKPGFIPPMEANAYMQSGFNSPTISSSFVSSTSRAGKIGLNFEQGRLGRLGRFPSHAYESWTTFLDFAGSRLGVDLRMRSQESSRMATSNLHDLPLISAHPSGAQSEQTSPFDTTTKSSSVSATLPPSLAPLARALSILYVLRCILGPLVESALLEDRILWVQEQLADENDVPGVENSERVIKSNDELKYKASLVPLFSQHGESGSARNIAVVVVPNYVME